MTHLSPYSYLDRGLVCLAILIWTLHRFWTTDRFASLSPSFARQGRLQPLVAWCMVISLTAAISYDMLAMYFKYAEGWKCSDEGVSRVASTSADYSDLHKGLIYPTDVLWSITCTFRTSSLFLTNSMWRFVCQKNFGSSPMSSWESKVSSAYSLVSVLLYIILQASFSGLVSTIAPQVLYSVELCVLIFMCQVANHRFTKLLPNLPPTSDGRVAIRFFMTMNNYLSVAMAMDVFGLFGINLDIILIKSNLAPKVILGNHFLTDLFTRIFNMGFCFTYLVIVFIIYPPTAKGSGSKSTASNKSKSGASSKRSKISTKKNKVAPSLSNAQDPPRESARLLAQPSVQSV